MRSTYGPSHAYTLMACMPALGDGFQTPHALRHAIGTPEQTLAGHVECRTQTAMPAFSLPASSGYSATHHPTLTLLASLLPGLTGDDLAGQLHAAVGALHLLLAHPCLRPRHHTRRRHLSSTGAASSRNPPSAPLTCDSTRALSRPNRQLHGSAAAIALRVTW